MVPGMHKGPETKGFLVPRNAWYLPAMETLIQQSLINPLDTKSLAILSGVVQ